MFFTCKILANVFRSCFGLSDYLLCCLVGFIGDFDSSIHGFARSLLRILNKTGGVIMNPLQCIFSDMARLLHDSRSLNLHLVNNLISSLHSMTCESLRTVYCLIDEVSDLSHNYPSFEIPGCPNARIGQTPKRLLNGFS